MKVYDGSLPLFFLFISLALSGPVPFISLALSGPVPNWTMPKARNRSAEYHQQKVFPPMHKPKRRLRPEQLAKDRARSAQRYKQMKVASLCSTLRDQGFMKVRLEDPFFSVPSLSLEMLRTLAGSVDEDDFTTLIQKPSETTENAQSGDGKRMMCNLGVGNCKLQSQLYPLFQQWHDNVFNVVPVSPLPVSRPRQSQARVKKSHQPVKVRTFNLNRNVVCGKVHNRTPRVISFLKSIPNCQRQASSPIPLLMTFMNHYSNIRCRANMQTGCFVLTKH